MAFLRFGTVPSHSQCLRALLMVVYVTLLVHLAAYLAQTGVAESGRLLLAELVCSMTAFMAVFVYLARGARLRQLQALVSPVRRWLLPTICAVMLLFGLFMRPEWFYVHIGVAVGMSAAYGLLLLYPDIAAEFRLRPWLVGFGLAAVAITLLRLVALNYSPPIHPTDEPWDLSWAVHYMRTGRLSDTLMLGLNGDPTYYIGQLSSLLGLWLRLFGVGLWQARLFSFVLAGLVIVLTSLTAQNVYGRRAAVVTGIVMFASTLMMMSWRVRHDIGLTVAVAGALWLVTEARKGRRPWLHAPAGLVLGWGMFAHYHALAFGPAFAVALYLPPWLSAWRQGRRWPERGAWLFGVGLGVGLLMVVAVQVLPDVNAFLIQRPPRTPPSLKLLVEAFFDQFFTLMGVSRWEALLVGLGTLVALSRRMFDVTLVLMLVFGHLALAVMTTISADYYLVPFAPIYALLVTTFVCWVADRLAFMRRGGVVLAIVLLLLPALGFTLKGPVTMLRNGLPVQRSTPPAAAWVLANVPRDQTILGENYYYLWLYDYPYASPEAPTFLPPDERARWRVSDVAWDPNIWLRFDIDVIIIDPTYSSSVILEPLHETGFLTANGYTLAASFPVGADVVTIYRRDVVG